MKLLCIFLQHTSVYSHPEDVFPTPSMERQCRCKPSMNRRLQSRSRRQSSTPHYHLSPLSHSLRPLRPLPPPSPPPSPPSPPNRRLPPLCPLRPTPQRLQQRFRFLQLRCRHSTTMVVDIRPKDMSSYRSRMPRNRPSHMLIPDRISWLCSPPSSKQATSLLREVRSESVDAARYNSHHRPCSFRLVSR
jgi:hypothetical protein